MIKVKKYIILFFLIAIVGFSQSVLAEDLNFTMNISYATNPYSLPAGRYTFNIDGKMYSVSLGSGKTNGITSFNVAIPLATSNPKSIKLVSFPTASNTFEILEQSYDETTKTLEAKMSRNIYFLVHHLAKSIDFNNFMSADIHLKNIKLALYDENDRLLQKSVLKNDIYGKQNIIFYAVIPGSYTLKIDSAPKDIAENYDLSKTFKLVVKADGRTTIDGNGPLGIPSTQQAYLDGVKTPFHLWLSHIPTIDKKVSNFTRDKGAFSSAVNAKPGDELEFKITRTINADHNFVLSLPNFIRYSSKINIEFFDEIPKGLEYVDGSLKIIENDTVTKDFVGEYNSAEHKIVVKHNSEANNLELSFDTVTKAPADRTIEIIFRCKLLEGYIEKIINIAEGNGKKSSAEIIPEPPVVTNTPQITAIPQIPKTGDNINIKLYSILAILAVGAAVIMLIKREKINK